MSCSNKTLLRSLEVKVVHWQRVAPFIENKLSECLIKTTWQINERIYSIILIKVFYIFPFHSCYTMAPFSGQLSCQEFCLIMLMFLEASFR